jgi:WD40 repeat protein
LRHRGFVGALSISPDGDRLVTGGGDNAVRIWDVETGRQLILFEEAHKTQVFRVGFSVDGSVVASGGDDGRLRLWDLRAGLRRGIEGDLPQLVLDIERIGAVGFSPDGSYLAAAGFANGDRGVCGAIWKTSSWGKCGEIRGRGVLGIAFNSAGDRIFIADMATNSSVMSFPELKPLALLPPATCIATNGNLIALPDEDDVLIALHARRYW